MRMLVTGATGFLGRHVVAEALARGHEARVLVRPSSRLDEAWADRVQVHRADLRAAAELDGVFDGIDVVIHLAASVGGDEDTQFAATVVGSERLFEAMSRSAARRLVLASSFSVYDWTAISRAVDEDSPFQQPPGLYARDSYSIAKVWQERVARRFAAEHGWDLLILRPGFIWGPGGEFFAGLGHRIGSVQIVVGPASRLPITYVENCAACFVTAAERTEVSGGVFNVVDPQRLRSWRFAGAHARWEGGRGFRLPVPYLAARAATRTLATANRLVFGGRAKLPTLLVDCRFQSRFKPVRVSRERVEAILGWTPQVDAEEALRRTFGAKRGGSPRRRAAGSSPAAASGHVTIVIPTFRRPRELAACLAACLAQKPPAGVTFSVLVVDNAPEASAADLTAEIARAAPAPVRYVHEREPGVSRARNAGLGAATGDFLAFIDDDEVVEDDWLARLLDAQAQWDADVVLAPVLPILPASADPAMEPFLSEALSHWIAHPTGAAVGSTLLDPFWARKGRAYPNLASGNCLIRRSAAAGILFDDRLGRFGGEDALFFSELAARGARIVWCAEAVAREHVPPGRLAVGYALRRAFRGGQVTSWSPLLLKRARPGMTTLSTLIGVVQAPAFLLLFCWSALVAPRRRWRHLTRSAGALGKVFWAAPFRVRSWPSWR